MYEFKSIAENYMTVAGMPQMLFQSQSMLGTNHFLLFQHMKQFLFCFSRNRTKSLFEDGLV